VSSSPTDSALVEVTMPQMGVSVAEGTLLEWRKRAGDWVEADEPIADVSTDKIDVELPSPATGRMAELLVEPGATVPVGTPMATIDPAARPGEPHADEHPPLHEPAPMVTPVVRRIAEREGIDVARVRGTGRGGRVTKKDLLAHLESRRAPAPLHTESPYRQEAEFAQPSSGEAAPPLGPGAGLSPMRRAIAEHMVHSLRTAAHCTTIAEADFSAVEGLREGRSYLPFVALAVVRVLREQPAFNATWDGQRLVHHEAVHLGIAVSLGEDGLIVPVVRDAHLLSVDGLAERIADLAKRARERRLEPDEVRDGTFTITNPGRWGTLMATPIINQPQVAILDLEAVMRRPVAVGDAIAVRPMAYLCLSWDHRAVDGEQAARFLEAVRSNVEGARGAG
jgi:pyruvate/2-oxoglutarate dehydrogenase complex dihydrolipoamide acyltransferase (E2) component